MPWWCGEGGLDALPYPIRHGLIEQDPESWSVFSRQANLPSEVALEAREFSVRRLPK
jgi:hypothetical protein